MLRIELERVGWEVKAAGGEIGWSQATGLAHAVLHEYTRHYAPEVAALVEAGDFSAAAAAFMANLHVPT